MIKKLFICLTFATLGLSGLSTSAMNISPNSLIESNLKIVNTQNLTLRGKNCQKLESLKSKDLARIVTKTMDTGFVDVAKTCKIGNKTHKMVLVSSGTKMGYVAKSFLSSTFTTKQVSDNFAVGKNWVSKQDLTLRDENCKALAIAEGDVDLTKALNKDKKIFTGKSLACKFGNKYYEMIQIGDKYVSPTVLITTK